MATKTFYLKDSAASGSSHGSLADGSAPSNNSTSTYFTSGLLSTSKYALMIWNGNPTVDSATAHPTASLGTSDAWRSENPLTGVFAAGNWVVSIRTTDNTSNNTTGNLRCRLWRSTSPTGAGATEITSSAQDLSALTPGATSNDTTKTIALGAVTLTNEYLFIQFGINLTLGNLCCTQPNFGVGATRSLITTPNFTLNYFMSAAVGAFTETGQAATLAVKMPAALGTFTETGQAASFVRTRPPIVAALGQFTETGQVAGLRAQRKITAAAGAYALTGNAAIFGGWRDTFDIEMPGVHLDPCIEDLAPDVVGATPVLINQDPAPGETRIPKSASVRFDLATLDATGTVDLAETLVYLDDVLVFDAGTFQGAYTGSYSNPQADVLRIEIEPPADFESEAVVQVRVVSKAVGDVGILDETYEFTIADTTAPRLLSVLAVDLQRVRCTFSEDVLESSEENAASALNPDNWVLERLGDYLTPVVSAYVTSVEVVTSGIVDLITDIPLTPDGNYRVTAAALEDSNGNAIEAPYDTLDFLGWVPPFPATRDLNLYKTRIPALNQREDETQDLLRFIGCFQEVLTLLLYDVDRFTDILDPDLAPEDFVDAMLADLGNPFAFDLALVDKRRLVQVLLDVGNCPIH